MDKSLPYENHPSRNKTRLELYFSVIDYWILIPVVIVSVIGLFALSKILSTGYEGAGQTMLLKQTGAVLTGMIIALVLGALETPMLKILAYFVYGTGVLLLILVLVDGYTLEATTGADSWLRLPVIGSFQPSELSKIGIIMLSAYFFGDITEGRMSPLKGYAIILGIFALPVFLISRQPDLGTIMMIFLITCCMFYIFGIKYRYIFLLGGLGVAALPIIWSFVLKPHQKNRILTFLYPGFSPAQAFHIEQAKTAIRAGGLTGSTLDTNVIVPVKESDFIYTGIAERLGFFGTTAIVVFLFFFIIRGLILSSRTDDPSMKFMSGGIAAMFGIHTIQNLGMCVGIMPITGIPLPFVSLGGSSMIVNFLALGVLLCISIETNILKKTSPT